MTRIIEYNKEYSCKTRSIQLQQQLLRVQHGLSKQYSLLYRSSDCWLQHGLTGLASNLCYTLIKWYNKEIQTWIIFCRQQKWPLHMIFALLLPHSHSDVIKSQRLASKHDHMAFLGHDLEQNKQKVKKSHIAHCRLHLRHVNTIPYRSATSQTKSNAHRTSLTHRVNGH